MWDSVVTGDSFKVTLNLTAKYSHTTHTWCSIALYTHQKSGAKVKYTISAMKSVLKLSTTGDFCFQAPFLKKKQTTEEIFIAGA